MDNIDFEIEAYRIGANELAYLGYQLLIEKGKFNMDMGITIAINEVVDKLFLDKQIAKLMHEMGVHIEYQLYLNYALTRIASYSIIYYFRTMRLPSIKSIIKYLIIAGVADFVIFPKLLVYLAKQGVVDQDQVIRYALKTQSDMGLGGNIQQKIKHPKHKIRMPKGK